MPVRLLCPLRPKFVITPSETRWTRLISCGNPSSGLDVYYRYPRFEFILRTRKNNGIMAAIWVFSFTVEWNYLFLTILQNKIWKFFLAYVVIGPSSYGRLKMPTKLLTYYLTFLSQNCDLMGVFLHCIVLYCFSIFDTCIHFNKMTGFPWQGLHVWQLSRTTSMKNKWPTLWKQEILATILLSIHA